MDFCMFGFTIIIFLIFTLCILIAITSKDSEKDYSEITDLFASSVDDSELKGYVEFLSKALIVRNNKLENRYEDEGYRFACAKSFLEKLKYPYKMKFRKVNLAAFSRYPVYEKRKILFVKASDEEALRNAFDAYQEELLRRKENNYRRNLNLKTI